ncbi:MAG: ATP-binding protein [Rhodospirillaceae bacterium]|nr:ATP-binding protein [Rhodospirillaceae bacterium]
MTSTGAAMYGRTPSVDGKRTGKQHELSEIVIGKDVLELVSSAMYIDPMTVYREYIQNAADAVDAARAAGLLSDSEPGKVEISIDPATRTVRIRDNGCGLPFSDFGRKLTALGGSAKRGMGTRGFRGVGRLAGLAYAQKLVFRSRVSGETEVSQLVWDCRELKSSLREAPYDTNVADLVRRVTMLERVMIDNVPERFFEVELRGVIRLRNDQLMSQSAIAEYLSQVAPVPFSPDFGFGAKISLALSQHVDLGELQILVGDALKPIYRPHRDRLSLDGKPVLKFNCLKFIEIPAVDQGVSAVAWILHHEYEGAIPRRALVKGLRLRTGNIQVGGHALLNELFPETRFNSWSVGEVHVIDRRIVPNGRRDSFEQNVHFNNLLNHLAPMARDIARKCRTSSVRRRWERDFELHALTVSETIDIIFQDSVNGAKREQLALAADQTLLRMSNIASKDILADSVEEREERITALQTHLSKAMNDDAVVSSPLMRLPEAQRKWYKHFFGLVYECSANRSAAKSLVDRILLRLE